MLVRNDISDSPDAATVGLPLVRFLLTEFPLKSQPGCYYATGLRSLSSPEAVEDGFSGGESKALISISDRESLIVSRTSGSRR